MPEDTNSRRHLHDRVNELHDRLTTSEKESIARDHEIEKRQERTTAHIEEMGRNMKEFQAQGAANAERQMALQGMHEDTLRENKHICATVDKAVDIATAARDIAEDAQVRIAPIVIAHQNAKDQKRDWRALSFKIMAYLIGTGIVAGVGALTAVLMS